MSFKRKIYQIERLKIFRFIVSGGTATIVDAVVYSLLVHLVGSPHTKVAHLEPKHLFCYSLSYFIGLITNFLISKYYVFYESTLKFHVQFFRFFIVALIGYVANYYVLLLLTWVVPFILPLPKTIFPTFVRILAAGSVAVGSFLMHKFFSFNIR
ncbi:MAG: GtrA family protein [Bacteroidia bacterium]|nr:GtrA family protein [Bacteroidia bacterium]MDW8159481.1 GtrA family protein [Bacteroidia bacterium]